MYEEKIRFINLFPNASQCIVQGKRIRLGEATPYVKVGQGVNNISIQVITGHGKRILKKTIKIYEGETSSFAVCEKMQMPYLYRVEENPLVRRADKAYARFINFANEPVTVFRVSGEIVCSLRPYQIGKYLLAQEGGYVFEIGSQKGKSVITCRFENNNKYSLYLIDSSPSKIGFYIYEDK